MEIIILCQRHKDTTNGMVSCLDQIIHFRGGVILSYNGMVPYLHTDTYVSIGKGFRPRSFRRNTVWIGGVVCDMWYGTVLSTPVARTKREKHPMPRPMHGGMAPYHVPYWRQKIIVVGRGEPTGRNQAGDGGGHHMVPYQPTALYVTRKEVGCCCRNVAVVVAGACSYSMEAWSVGYCTATPCKEVQSVIHTLTMRWTLNWARCVFTYKVPF